MAGDDADGSHRPSLSPSNPWQRISLVSYSMLKYQSSRRCTVYAAKEIPGVDSQVSAMEMLSHRGRALISTRDGRNTREEMRQNAGTPGDFG